MPGGRAPTWEPNDLVALGGYLVALGFTAYAFSELSDRIRRRIAARSRGSST